MSQATAVASELTDEVRFFYWHSDISTTQICDTYGLRARELPDVGGPLALDSACAWCGAPEIVRSRSERKRRIEWWAKRERNKIEIGWLPGDRCSTCNEAFKEWRLLVAAQEREIRASLVADLKTMPYRDYLRTDHWREVRRRALARARHRCQLCNASDRPLQVHHRTYERRGEEWAADVIALCNQCHATFHGAA